MTDVEEGRAAEGDDGSAHVGIGDDVDTKDFRDGASGRVDVQSMGLSAPSSWLLRSGQ